jgi:ribonuclease HI
MLGAMDAATWHLSCDGTAVPNPGVIGVGAVLVAPDGTRHTVSRKSEHTGCNNEAEIRALIAALEHAHSLGARNLHVQCDSDVVVQHVVGGKHTEVARLAPLFAEARAWWGRMERAELVLVPRRHNADADALARAAVGLLPKVTRVPRLRRKR